MNLLSVQPKGRSTFWKRFNNVDIQQYMKVIHILDHCRWKLLGNGMGTSTNTTYHEQQPKNGSTFECSEIVRVYKPLWKHGEHTFYSL